MTDGQFDYALKFYGELYGAKDVPVSGAERSQIAFHLATKSPLAGGLGEHNKMKLDTTAFTDLFKVGRDSVPSMDAASFRKQLGWLIKESPAAVRMTINPGMAAVMLERNSSDEWHNRPASLKGVARFARAMGDGRWLYTAEPIIFSSTGNLLNGQHRLSACINAGATIEVLVAFGVEDEAFRMMDTGVSRTAGHIFAIENIPHYIFTASVCRIVRSYLDAQAWTGNTHQGVSVPDNDELLDFYYQHPNIPASYPYARKLAEEGLISPRWAGALHYICWMKNHQQANEFFAMIGSGAGLVDKSPEHLLRKRMTASARASGDNKEADLYLAAYTIQAWNAKRKGDKRSIFRWRGDQNPNESFPRAA